MIDVQDVRTLFDACPDVVFFAKDRAGRYTCGNRTLLQRLGLEAESGLVGKDPRDVFDKPLGSSYFEQDQRVIASGQPLLDELERHLFPNHSHGWCLTRKLPLMKRGKVVGLMGISRDLHWSPQAMGVAHRLRLVVDHVHENFAEPIRIAALAEMAHLSVAQFERQFTRVMQITPRAWLTSVRIDAAMRVLETEDASVAAVAHACGFADHSAFTRSFQKHVGLTPSAYRASRRGESR